ncbi:MAG TPA: VCBS repeat-containing protein [Planctomycetota bacterium]|nr:VCBS repeat-containing protein [Planctomycetota bacterium]
MMRKPAFFLVGAGALLLLADAPRAQVDVQWVTYTKQPSKLTVAPSAISDSDTQAQFRTGDLNQDGWDDLVVMRKQQASQIGKRTAMLLINVNGVLTDKTAQYATATDVPGDNGFLTPCNNRESSIVDVDNDGWLDVVTSTAISDGDPKVLSHPRVYMNLGDDAGGNWLGLKFEEARIPQLKTVGGLSVAPRFCGMGAADLTGDGFADLYYVDYDSTETGIFEQSSWDLNDRCLVNDGNGFFSDQSASMFTTNQLLSAFGADAQIIDLNGDGANDVVKDTTLSNPTATRALYNNPAAVGNFTAMGVSDFGSNAPYGMDVGSLNNDGIPDVAIADDGNDKFRLGASYDLLNKIVWGPLKNYSFVTGSDDGFGHNVHLRDLDGNGWNDVLITDVDGDLVGCSRRMHIYHNTGSVPGDMNIVLKEESQQASGGTGAGWHGAVGFSAADLKGSYDMGFGDFDKDGDLDFVFATCSGTNYWQNETNPIQEVCQTDMGFAGPGNMSLSVCGDDLTQASSVATMELENGVPLQPIFLVVSLSANPSPFKGGTLVPLPILAIVTGFSTDASGGFAVPIPGGASTPTHVYLQAIVKAGTVYQFSNAVDVLMGF